MERHYFIPSPDTGVCKICGEGILTEEFHSYFPEKKSSTNKFVELSQEIGKLVAKKNAAYGDSFSKSADFMKLLYPEGINPEDYWKALVIIRIFDKLMRLATNNDPSGESPFNDIAGYALLGIDATKKRE